jgi:hypothetical protein
MLFEMTTKSLIYTVETYTFGWWRRRRESLPLLI